MRDSGHKRNAANGAAWLADIGCCLRFFTRVCVPRLGPADDPQAPPALATAIRALPLAGMALTLPAALVLAILSSTALPAMLVAVFTLAALAATTGALHEDGLADVADGFFGGATRERRLEIMADSRSGAFGVLASVLTQIALVAALSDVMLRYGPFIAALVLICGAAVSRTAALIPWTFLEAARPGGLSERFGAPNVDTLRTAAGIAALLNVIILVALGFSAWAISLAAAAFAALGVALLARARIGGHTGDVIGAAQQIAWLSYLAALLMLPFSP